MPKPKRNALFPLGYDEVSLVDEGAGEEVDVLIAKRNNAIGKAKSGTVKVGSQSKTPGKGGTGKRSNPCNPKSSTGAKTGNSSKRAVNWKEEKHPRDAKGRMAQSSSESKAKNGKGGTTKSKLDAACRGKKKGGGKSTYVQVRNKKPIGEITSDPDEQKKIRSRRRKKQQKGSVEKSALSTWRSNDAHIRAIMERNPQ